MHPSNPKRPLVSVVIPAYNAEDCVPAAIDSALFQTYRDLEVVVVDDGSTDGTADVLATYGDALVVVRQRNAGVSAARNAGVRRARGNLIAFLDADDAWEPDKVARQVVALQESPQALVCITGFVAIRADGTEAYTRGCDDPPRVRVWDFEGVLRRFHCLTSTFMVRREGLQQVDGFDEALKTAEDIDLLARLAAHGPVVDLREPLLRYRLVEDSLSRNVFTGNRLRVLDKLWATPMAERAAIRRALERTRASVLYSYADDLVWHGRADQAIPLLIDSLRARPTLASAALLCKASLPRPVFQGLRRLRAGLAL